MSIGTPWGVWLVARQEFRIRLRTGRWRWLLGVWVLVLALFTGLLDLTLNTGYGFEDDDTRRGVPLFGILMLFVLVPGARHQPRAHLSGHQRRPRTRHARHAAGDPAAAARDRPRQAGGRLGRRPGRARPHASLRRLGDGHRAGSRSRGSRRSTASWRCSSARVRGVAGPVGPARAEHHLGPAVLCGRCRSDRRHSHLVRARRAAHRRGAHRDHPGRLHLHLRTGAGRTGCGGCWHPIRS